MSFYGSISPKNFNFIFIFFFLNCCEERAVKYIFKQSFFMVLFQITFLAAFDRGCFHFFFCAQLNLEKYKSYSFYASHYAFYEFWRYRAVIPCIYVRTVRCNSFANDVIILSFTLCTHKCYANKFGPLNCCYYHFLYTCLK